MTSPIGPIELEDARTLAAYWLMADDQKRRNMWQSDLKKICEALLSLPSPSPKSDNYQHLLAKAWKINQEHYGGKSDYWNGYSQAVWDLKEMDDSSKL